MMTTIWAGLASGSIYALVALGYNLTLVLTGVLNFANAQFIVIGGFVAYWGLTQQDWSAPAVVLISVVVCAAVAMLEELIAIRPLRGAKGHTELVTTLGALTVIAGILVVIWGSEPLTVRLFDDQAIDLFGGRVRPSELALIAVATVFAAGFALWTQRSRLGLAGLARSEDIEAARLRGVNTRRLAVTGFLLAGAFGGLVGPLVAQKTYAVASLGLVLALKGFVAMAVGGIGSHTGALVGGLSVGLIEAFAARYIGSDFGDISVVLILFAMLMLRPTGILAKGQVRLV
jgi:branched-chain amino acid transport system permease protein